MAGRVLVFYDNQCEICQAGVSWLRFLDRRKRTECVPLDSDLLARAGLDLEACSRQLHIVTREGRVLAGWDAVAHLARLFPPTWPMGALGAVPLLRAPARLLYQWVARNRYALSKCRGGRCRSWNPGVVARRAPLAALWTCHWMGMLMRLPLTLGAIVGQAGGNLVRYTRTWRRPIDLLDGRLQLLMLNGLPCDLITLLFGEHFLAILYDGILIDPGPTRLRGALSRHLKRLPAGRIAATAATHHHEEHAGNLNWLAERRGVPLYVGEATARCLSGGGRLPWIRRFMIGDCPPLRKPYRLLGERLGELEVYAAPGHSDDHIVLYDRREKILFAGDSFMGAYFSAPNPDVDSRAWIDSLERLLSLDIEILIEGHGHIHTLRPEIPDSCPLVVRRAPRQELLEKLQFYQWLRDQIETGTAEGLPPDAIEVTCFPWGRRFAWERFLNDALSRFLSRGHWSRAELVRSFARPASSAAVLPLLYEARMHRHPATPDDRSASISSEP